MQYRRFGQTDWNLSVLSLGTMRCLASAEIAAATIQTAIQAGINHIETAQGYGQSEIHLGQALRELWRSGQLQREQIKITTKIPPLSDRAATMAAIAQSRDRLQLDYIDGLAIHGVNTPAHLAMIQADQPMMQAMRAAIDQGQIRQVGFSTHGPLEVIISAIATGQFAFVNLHYGLLGQRNQAAIVAAQQQDMGIFIISPADKAGQLYTPSAKLTELCAPLSPLAANYRFLLSDPRITTLSVGPADPSELAPPLALADRTAPLSAAEVARFAQLDRVQTEVLGTDRCHQCYACLPCPAGINIPEVLRLRNLAVAYDMQQFGEYRYGMFENAGHWFPGNKGNRCTDCGDCLPRCPSQLAIPDLLRDTHDRLNGKPRRRLWER
jgi:uncharacterized protein